MGPMLLTPYYVSPIWGGPHIAQARGLPWTPEHNYGESFDVSAHPTTMGMVRNGPCAGMTLAEAIATHHDEILGDVDDSAPLQATFIDAGETLSVQVHPGEAYAQQVEADYGKVESWYVLAAEPGATLIAGCTTDDVCKLRDAVADDSIGERFGKHIPVQAGDFLLIPPGLMHALGAGIFTVEIASLGNTTYRICDWGRGRQLHVDKAFDVLRVDAQASVVHLGAPQIAGVDQEQLGVDAGFFKSYVADVTTKMHFSCDGRYAVVTCVDGTATVATSEGSVPLGYTESCLVPASAEHYVVTGPCRILRSIRT